MSAYRHDGRPDRNVIPSPPGVSYLFAQGVPLELISGLVRQASPAVTRTVSLHLRADRKAEAAAGLDRLWATGS